MHMHVYVVHVYMCGCSFMWYHILMCIMSMSSSPCRRKKEGAKEPPEHVNMWYMFTCVVVLLDGITYSCALCP